MKTIPSIKIVTEEIHTLLDVSVRGRTEFERFNKVEDYRIIELTFTDGFKTGVSIDDRTDKLTVATYLREMAYKIEQSR